MASSDGDSPEAVPARPLILRLAAVAGVAAVVGVVVGGGGSYFLLSHFYTTSPAPVTIRTITSSGGSKTTSLSSVVDQVAPSVVEVVREQSPPATPTVATTSDGFVASSSGLVVTSEGAVAGAAGVEVVLATGDVLPATIAAADPGTGIVVLQVSSPSLPPPLSFASGPDLGAAAIAISLPLGGTESVDVGTVSEVGLTAEVPDPAAPSGTALIDGISRTDSPEPQGSSGAPLVNASGQVIGILTGQRMQPTSGGSSASAFGFALDGSAAAYLVQALSTTGSGPPPVGVVTRWLDPATAAAGSLPPGAQVAVVVPGTAAAAAGLRVGDVVIEVDGTAVVGSTAPRYPDLVDLLIPYGPGTQVTLTVFRSGATRQLSLTVPAD